MSAWCILWRATQAPIPIAWICWQTVELVNAHAAIGKRDVPRPYVRVLQ